MTEFDERWIVVHGWDRFQHYRDRNPVWIKLYTDLPSNPEWMSLTLAERGLLTTLWVEYARANCELRCKTLRQRVKSRAFNRHIVSLNHAGFIHLCASRPLAQRREEKKEDGASAPKPKPKGEPRPNADAYKPAGAPVDIQVDEAMLRLAKGWLSP